MVIIKNKRFTLTIDDQSVPVSLILNKTGKECLNNEEKLPLFSLTEERPYKNEIKLSHPNKRTVFNANSVVRNGSRLIVGFELISVKAVIELTEADDYVNFTLVDYIIPEGDFLSLAPMDSPPVCAFRLIQLSLIKHKNVGEWLNVSFDEDVAVNILSSSPYADAGIEKRKNFRIMYADAIKEIKLKGAGACLIVSSPEELLDCIDSVEKDFNLPRGVESRRRDEINRSIYITSLISPKNVDEHIRYAKMGGFTMMQIYFTAFLKSSGCGYELKGDYIFNDNYPRGKKDLEEVLTKLKNAGISPGFHFLHTHIGIKSSYVTPVADARLNHTRMFTISKPLSKNDTTIYVYQNPEGTVMHPDCRVLQLGGELIYYESYSSDIPYCFKGCKRGYFNTTATPHASGTIGGIIDISEFGAASIYIDQRTDLQDEIAEKIAEIYDLGFDFMYFDGSEGTNIPHYFYVPYAQYRVYKKAEKPPIFCEGAAKAHFSWHMLSGANAFDVFPADVFKKKLLEHPFEEASRMANDFTRVNFGWWSLKLITQPDMFEFATSKAASHDCPGSVTAEIEWIEANPRAEDIFEVMRRWEDVRKKNLLTKEQKIMLRDTETEYTLLINEKGEYELTPYYEIKTNCADISAFNFERCGKNYVVCWHKNASADITINLPKDSIICEKDIGKERISVTGNENSATFPISGKCYVSTNLSMDELIRAFSNATI